MDGKDLHRYYGNFNVEYYFLKYLQFREFVVLPSKMGNVNRLARKRMMRVHNIQSFRFWFDILHAFEGDRMFNLYYSAAAFRGGIPKTDPTKLYERDAIDFSEFNINAYKYIESYDFLLDIDAGDFSELHFAVESARDISLQLDFLNCPYQLRFSGKGFHFIIPYRYFEYLNLKFDPNAVDNIYLLMRDIAIYFYDRYSEMVDFNIYDSRRIIKLPYSWSLYDEGFYLCRPISIEELKVFDLNKFKYFDDLREDVVYNKDGNIEKLIKVVMNGKKKNRRF